MEELVDRKNWLIGRIIRLKKIRKAEGIDRIEGIEGLRRLKELKELNDLKGFVTGLCAGKIFVALNNIKFY